MRMLNNKIILLTYFAGALFVQVMVFEFQEVNKIYNEPSLLFKPEEKLTFASNFKIEENQKNLKNPND